MYNCKEAKNLAFALATLIRGARHALVTGCGLTEVEANLIILLAIDAEKQTWCMPKGADPEEKEINNEKKENGQHRNA